MKRLTSAKAILEALLVLFKPKGSWTQGTWARDKAGALVDSNAKTAVCWCLDGGLNKVEGPWATGHSPARNRAERLLADAIQKRTNGTSRNIVNYNDTYARIKTDITRVIKMALEEA